MTEPGTLVVDMDGVALPVTVRDSRLKVVATGSTGEPITLPPGTYAVSVPLPTGPDSFDEVVVVGPGSRDTRLAGPAQTVRDPTSAAIALVERGRPDAAVHVLRGDLANLPTLGVALLGFTALQLGDDATAAAVADRPGNDPDVLALRAAVLQRRPDAGDRLDELARLTERALALVVPRLRLSALALVAAVRDTGSTPPTAAFRELLRQVRRCDMSRTMLESAGDPAVTWLAEDEDVWGSDAWDGFDPGVIALPAWRTSELVLAAAPAAEQTVHTFVSPRGTIRIRLRQTPDRRFEVEITAPSARVRCFLIRYAVRAGGRTAIAAPVRPKRFGTPVAVVDLPGFATNLPWTVQELAEPFTELDPDIVRDSVDAASDRETLDAWTAVAEVAEPATSQLITRLLEL
ncbi:hypothetical protein GCM10009827_070360 [Dactylosporangium maewongense]|uniref:Uncharacterized protein n=1 Tax=Dactylosporangium maewongense TaxID=634393 RepID=A0ABP4MFJ9_9ACTN